MIWPKMSASVHNLKIQYFGGFLVLKRQFWVGYLHYDHFGVRKSDQKLHFDDNLHMMSHRLVIWEVHILIDYECLDYLSYDMINTDTQFRHSVEVLHRYTVHVIFQITIMTDIKRSIKKFLFKFVFRNFNYQRWF